MQKNQSKKNLNRINKSENNESNRSSTQSNLEFKNINFIYNPNDANKIENVKMFKKKST
jgi:ABC-type bacteriocin/lantibiotic exporter with double-glycine peptidase domain